MPGLRDIKRRIKSVQSTRKITRAMQLVSAAKMRKAQSATLASRKYSHLAWELILNLSSSKHMRDSLIKAHPRAQKMAIVLLSSNRGLVGSLNTNLIKSLKDIVAEHNLPTDIITYGRKGREAVVRSSQTVLADFEKYDRSITSEDIFPLAKLVNSLYRSGEYKKILIVYNHFVSTLVQKPTVKQLLPLPQSFIRAAGEARKEVTVGKTGYNYMFEPTPRMVFHHLVPRILESQIYQTVLESEASEQSARMIMMKNATDAAGDLISDYTLAYNKMRQNKITSELAEITAGKIALE